MVPPLFHLRGFDRPDPLDALSKLERTLLHVLVTALVFGLFLYVVLFVLDVAELADDRLVWIEFFVATPLYAMAVVALRKSSSLFLMSLFAAVGFLLDLFVQAHVRDAGGEPFWWYTDTGLLGGLPPLLQFVVSWTVDAFVAGPVTLWVSRLVARALARDRDLPEPPHTTDPEHQKLFRAPWIAETGADKPARGWIFRGFMAIALGYLGYLVVVSLALLGASPWPEPIQPLLEQTFANPAMTVTTLVKLSVNAALLLAAAYNVRLRYHASLVLLVGHGICTVAALALVHKNPDGSTEQLFLLASAATDGLFCVFFAVAMARARRWAKAFDKDDEFPIFYSIPHRLTLWAFRGVGAFLVGVFLLAVASRLWLPPDAGFGAIFGYPDSQLINALTAIATLGFLAFLIADREALRDKLIGVITLGAVVAVVASAGFLVLGDGFGELAVKVRPGWGEVYVDWYFMLLPAVAGGLALLLAVLHKMFWDVEYTISTFGPSAGRNVLALHEAFYREPNSDPFDDDRAADDGAEVLTRLDRHLSDLRGRKRGVISAPFALLEHVLSLIHLRPPVSVMSADERRWFLRRYVLRPPVERGRAVIPALADLTNLVGVALHSLITLAHYDRRRVWAETGYVPPGARDRLQGEHAVGRAPFAQVAELPKDPGDPKNWAPRSAADAPELLAPRVVTPVRDAAIPREVDYLVVGSGAGGATVAYRILAEQPSARVLVVERGGRFSPLQDMNDSELEMIRRMYKEGGIQQTKRLDMMIMQGECVGGSTVINNGICFELPPEVRRDWERIYGGQLDGLDAAYRQVADDLGIADVPQSVINTRVEERFAAGIAALNAERPAGERLAVETVRSNFRDPLGSGLGSYGNRRLRKRSMLETYLPWAEARGAQIVSDTSAVRFVTGGGDRAKRATAVLLRSVTGTPYRVRVERAVIVAAGAVASSHFLMRSGVEGEVGRGLTCNFALPITARYPQALHAYDGLQISLGASDPRGRAVFETIGNPPGTCAIELPFFFERHAEAMRRYVNLVNLAALVGSEARGVVARAGDLVNGRAVSWTLGERDRAHIGYALSTLVDLARCSGAEEVYMTTQPGLAVAGEADMKQLAEALVSFPYRMRDFRMFTSHPSGGNAFGAARSAVVDPTFRVRGYDNVYVADASLLPTATTVNPQWTIMALATLAAASVKIHDPVG